VNAEDGYDSTQSIGRKTRQTRYCRGSDVAQSHTVTHLLHIVTKYEIQKIYITYTTTRPFVAGTRSCQIPEREFHHGCNISHFAALTQIIHH